MNSKDLKGIPVLSIADGEKLGALVRAYVDTAERRIVGFAYKAGGGGFMQAESEPKLDVAEVHTLGPDGLMLDHKGGETGATVSQRYSELLMLDDIANLPVLSEGGVSLGSIASVEFDPHSYALTGFSVSHGHFKANQEVAIDQVSAIGRDFIIITDATTRAASPEQAVEVSHSGSVISETTYAARPAPEQL